jgi:phosphate transport system ATP-binding protein
VTERTATLTPAPPRAREPRATPDARPRISVRKLDALFGSNRAVRDVSIDFPDGQVTGDHRPSGCGKSTLLRCLNRMHETIPLTSVNGEVLLDGQDVYARGINPIEVRRRIGMVFQRPTPFPTMSIRDNVAAGLRASSRERPSAPARGPDRRGVAQSGRALGRGQGSPPRLRDRALRRPAATLCIARAMATRPASSCSTNPPPPSIRSARRRSKNSCTSFAAP